jgi:uncharacterized protein (UPF0147 family)
MKIRIVLVGLTSLVMLFLVGCTKVPQQTITEAKTALEAAKKADAQKYARSQFQAAEVSYELAKKELSEESKKMPFMRKYSKIIETLKSSTSAAESAQSAAETAKNQLTDETQGLLARAQTIVDSLDTIIIATKNKKKSLESLSPDLDSVNANIRVAGAVLGAGDLFAAKDKAVMAHTSAQTLSAKIQEMLPAKKVSLVKKK